MIDIRSNQLRPCGRGSTWLCLCAYTSMLGCQFPHCIHPGAALSSHHCVLWFRLSLNVSQALLVAVIALFSSFSTFIFPSSCASSTDVSGSLICLFYFFLIFCIYSLINLYIYAMYFYTFYIIENFVLCILIIFTPFLISSQNILPFLTYPTMCPLLFLNPSSTVFKPVYSCMCDLPLACDQLNNSHILKENWLSLS